MGLGQKVLMRRQFLESFATKNISGSEDRAEDTKRKKLAVKAEKLVELMMVSGIPTSSGYEERIRFSEMEVVDRGANEGGLIANAPDGHQINGWDVNIAGVRTTTVKRHVRYHEEPVSIPRRAQKMLRLAGIHNQSQAIRQRRHLRRENLRRLQTDAQKSPA